MSTLGTHSSKYCTSKITAILLNTVLQNIREIADTPIKHHCSKTAVPQFYFLMQMEVQNTKHYLNIKTAITLLQKF